jgi:hypothetical protein
MRSQAAASATGRNDERHSESVTAEGNSITRKRNFQPTGPVA